MNRCRALALGLVLAITSCAFQPDRDDSDVPKDSSEACEGNCKASITIANQTSWNIAKVYATPCGGAPATNVLSAPIGAGATATIKDISAGCYDLTATDSSDTEMWNDEIGIQAGSNSMWILTNAAAESSSCGGEP